MTNREQAIARASQKNLAKQKADLLEVLSTPAGRRVYALLVEASGLYGTPPATEPERTEWMGRRAFGLEIRNAFRGASPQWCFDGEQEMAAIRANDDEAIRRAAEKDLENKTRR